MEEKKQTENMDGQVPQPLAEPVAVRRPQDVQREILSYVRDIVIWMSGFALVFLLLFRMAVVSGASMQSTLESGDVLILRNKAISPSMEYGDIVVLSKASFDDGEPLIKRIIATEGQEVDIDFDTGIVYVDGKPLDEPYTNTLTTLSEGTSFPLTVEEGCVFVMGDNRNHSRDSRDPAIGQIDCRQIVGKAVFLLIPGKDPLTDKRDFSRIGVIS